MSLDEIAEEVGTVEQERDSSKDNKLDRDIKAFDLSEYVRGLEEYEGGWDNEGLSG